MHDEKPAWCNALGCAGLMLSTESSLHAFSVSITDAASHAVDVRGAIEVSINGLVVERSGGCGLLAYRSSECKGAHA